MARAWSRSASAAPRPYSEAKYRAFSRTERSAYTLGAWVTYGLGSCVAILLYEPQRRIAAFEHPDANLASIAGRLIEGRLGGFAVFDVLASVPVASPAIGS